MDKFSDLDFFLVADDVRFGELVATFPGLVDHHETPVTW